MNIYNSKLNPPLIDAHGCANAVEGRTPWNGPSFLFLRRAAPSGGEGAAPLFTGAKISMAALIIMLAHTPLSLASELEPINLGDNNPTISDSLHGLQLAAI